MKNKTPLLFLFVLIISCSSHSSTSELLSRYGLDVTKENNFSVLIIPDIGCSGCIYQAKQFLKKHINTPRIHFIVTSITSKKDIEFKFEDIKHRTDKIMFDYDNNIIQDNIVEFYPRILHFSFGEEVFNREILPGQEIIFENFENTFLNK